jgi:hypothetical protein
MNVKNKINRTFPWLSFSVILFLVVITATNAIEEEAEVSYPLLDEGYLSIGYSDFSEPEFIKKSLGENDSRRQRVLYSPVRTRFYLTNRTVSLRPACRQRCELISEE